MITDINCYYDQGDRITCLEVCDSNSGYYGEMYFMCENKHVLRFYRNTDGSISKDSLSAYFDSLQQKYQLFFQNSPSKIFMHFEYVRNFMVTEYWYGAAYSIRTLAERIIYENYGVYFFSNKQELSNISDEKEIEDISEKIRLINSPKLLRLLREEDKRREVLGPNSEKNSLKLRGKGLEYAKIMCNKIDANKTSSIFLDPDKYKLLLDVFNDTSPALHGRIPMDSSKTSHNLGKTLEFYQAYFEKGNQWRTIYE